MTAIEQSAELGRKAANARYAKKDQTLYSHFANYQAKFVNAAPLEERKGLVEAFNASYKEEASYYIGQRVAL